MASAYTKEQVASYLTLIGLPEHLHNAPPSLTLLKQLHIHTISTLPYENLSLHYNISHSIVLDLQSLFTKLVTSNRGRGGYCMELPYHTIMSYEEWASMPTQLESELDLGFMVRRLAIFLDGMNS